jgi:c-di-GMP-related signal transduction protein
MAQIVNQLPIEAQMKEALTSRSGWEGKLLSLIESHEANDVEAVVCAFRDLKSITALHGIVWVIFSVLRSSAPNV